LQGFSGHGVALTGLAGKLVAEAIAGQAERLDLMASIQVIREEIGPVRLDQPAHRLKGDVD
jgi:gamma-glutamylputrescine oxidase